MSQTTSSEGAARFQTNTEENRDKKETCKEIPRERKKTSLNNFGEKSRGIVFGFFDFIESMRLGVWRGPDGRQGGR